MTKPNSDSTYTAASRPIPSSHSLRKLDITPIVKNVMTKKMPRNVFASPIADRIFAVSSGVALSASAQNHDERQRRSRE